MEGWGDLSVKNLKTAIDQAKNISLNRFIYSIGIRHIGQENAKILASFFKSVDQFSNIFQKKDRDEILKNLNDLDGIGETQIFSLKNFFDKNKNIEIVQKLITKLNIEDFKETNIKGKLSNTNVMFTGGFEKISRSEAKTLTENLGGKVLGSVSKKLNILVVGNSKPTKKKIEKAKELKIKIFSENEWYELLSRLKSFKNIFRLIDKENPNNCELKEVNINRDNLKEKIVINYPPPWRLLIIGSGDLSLSVFKISSLIKTFFS